MKSRFLKITVQLLNYLFNTKAASLYFILFAFVIGLATFIENDYGTSAAQKVIFRAWWFEVLLILFSICILYNILKFRMIQNKKWALLLFHLAIIVIIIGAGITRYFGFEGVMHIREGQTQNTFLSAESHLNFSVLNEGKTYDFNEPLLLSSLGTNHWENSYQIGNHILKVRLKNFIPNPKQVLITSLDGLPILKIVAAGMNGREEHFLSFGDSKQIQGILFNFSENEYPGAFNLKLINDQVFFKSAQNYEVMEMATQKKSVIDASESYLPLTFRALHSHENKRFVFAEYRKNGKLSIESENVKVKNESLLGLDLEVSVDNHTQNLTIFGRKGIEGMPKQLQFGNFLLNLSYGAKKISVPFGIHLNRFIMDRYPGTNNASSYASEVMVVTEKNTQFPFRIYMNNILNYGGYRFFQSSFDRDEKGTYLSVNNDFWGTTISYLGYILLTIGMILSLFTKNSRFQMIIRKISRIQNKASAILIILLLSSAINYSQTTSHNPIDHYMVSAPHAKQFSLVIVQDFNGRMKPMHTLTRELLRKIHRKETYLNYNSDQVILSMFANPNAWYGEKLIKLPKHKDILKILNLSGDYAAYKDFFATNGSYKLRNEIRNAYQADPKERGVFEKELIKIDERINIVSMIFSGSLFKIIPVAGDQNSTWTAKHNHSHGNQNQSENDIADKFFSSYLQGLKNGISGKGYMEANALISELQQFQIQTSQDIIPSEVKINAEILLNKMNIFNRLSLGYILLGIASLVILFLEVFSSSFKGNKAFKIVFYLVLISFLLHTLGLGLRWFVSGRAPWSNGYESMIYIAWTTVLSGLIFSRKSIGGLAATCILGGTLLFVSMLSFLDPQITPLVPVLKSYWLTIHVSLEAGSYGFLMLGAIIGIINLFLFLFLKPKNQKNINRLVTEMSYISELTLIAGLFMISIGTYLGGVWANESWGRYWGWDPKETWALVTILVYAFILHLRLIPKLNNLYLYNLVSVMGLASVIMTYFGVNYYLSGLHSYASGDPIPIPNWVYYALISFLLLGVFSYFKYRKFYQKKH